MPTTPELCGGLLLVGAVLIYYGRLDPLLGSLSTRLLRFAPHPGGMSVSEARGVAVLTTAGVGQVLFALGLVIVTGVEIRALPAEGEHLAYLLAGPILGLGELGLSSFLGRVAVQVAVRIRGDRNPANFEHWIAMSKGGWMRSYLRTIDAVPLPFAFGLTILYVVAEETVFRGVVAGAFASYGLVWAILISTAVFVIVQAFQMPGWRNALFALSGALVMGIVHAVLYLEGGALAPLILAHLTFFWLAVG